MTYRVSLRELKRLSKAFSDILNKKAKKGVYKTEHAVQTYADGKSNKNHDANAF